MRVLYKNFKVLCKFKHIVLYYMNNTIFQWSRLLNRDFMVTQLWVAIATGPSPKSLYKILKFKT